MSSPELQPLRHCSTAASQVARHAPRSPSQLPLHSLRDWAQPASEVMRSNRASMRHAACSSPQYIIGTKTGQLLVAHGKPSFDEKTGLYVYKDAEGKKATIPKDDVSQILER